jgi:hypothetical protein
MMVSMGVVPAEVSTEPGWFEYFHFYGFDIPVPDTVRYTIHHAIRSITSLAACVPRHRFTTDDPNQVCLFIHTIVYLLIQS